jgi:hypothetical protein
MVIVQSFNVMISFKIDVKGNSLMITFACG